MNKFLKVLCIFLGIPTKEKEVLNEGVIGYYDCKPYHNFHYALIYAKDQEVYNDGKIEIFTRNHKGTTFVNVLVNEEDTFNPEEYDYPHLEELLDEKGFEATEKSVVVIAFQHTNEKTKIRIILFKQQYLTLKQFIWIIISQFLIFISYMIIFVRTCISI